MYYFSWKFKSFIVYKRKQPITDEKKEQLSAFFLTLLSFQFNNSVFNETANYSTLKKKKVELVVPSEDLGYLWQPCNRTYNYLSSMSQKTLVLNGDIIDVWHLENYISHKHILKVISHNKHPKELRYYI
jgi:hypothetical protein